MFKILNIDVGISVVVHWGLDIRQTCNERMYAERIVKSKRVLIRVDEMEW